MRSTGEKRHDTHNNIDSSSLRKDLLSRTVNRLVATNVQLLCADVRIGFREAFHAVETTRSSVHDASSASKLFGSEEWDHGVSSNGTVEVELPTGDIQCHPWSSP